MAATARQAIAAEFLGTLLLLATVVGSGVMAERLAGGNDAVALLGNTVATAAMLYVLITIFGPLSGAHFNPAVTMVLGARHRIGYLVAQLAGALAGVMLAHLMFDLTILQTGVKPRAGIGQWTGEFVATFGLVLSILLGSRHRPEAVPALVALWVTAGYWFTSSTSFANPAVTLARAFTDSFAGLRQIDVPAFVVMQAAGALAAAGAARLLLRPTQAATSA